MLIMLVLYCETKRSVGESPLKTTSLSTSPSAAESRLHRSFSIVIGFSLFLLILWFKYVWVYTRVIILDFLKNMFCSLPGNISD